MSSNSSMLLTSPMPCATLPTARGKGRQFARAGAGALVDGRKCGPLAQLAEQVTLNHPVPGSTPGRLTKLLWQRQGVNREQRRVGPSSGKERLGEVSELVDEH